ncbi:peptidase S9 [Blastomonas marina]|uniref:Peptidase S9 n=1 Tax=Blastomonas marina TaxID=1867408 RepID=A0ABQ1FCC8_9SPHN|nr:S9 family peptidase [Blastomonas marina]GGA05030.1 peptidase S9 [Blastomonas marina]
MKICKAILAATAAAIVTPVAAQDAEELAARYGARPSILDISLSPSGNKLAIVAPDSTHGEVVKVIDLAGGAEMQSIMRNTEQNGDITSCDWATEARLVCELDGAVERDDGVLLWFSRIFSFNEDGSDIEVLTQSRSFRALGFRQDGGSIVALDVPGEENNILMTRDYVPEMTVGTRLANEESGLGVDAVDITNRRRKVVERPDDKASAFVADETGRVRLKVLSARRGDGTLLGRRMYYYRPAGDDGWREFEQVTIDGKERTDFVPAAVDSKRNVVYGWDTIGGYDAIVEVKLDGSGEGRVVMMRDDVDVDRLIRIGRKRRVVGASYATEKRAVEYFDSELGGLASELEKALPGNPLVDIVGANADESKLLLIASSDTDPGMLYMFHKDTMQLEPLLPMRDYLVNKPMGEMRPVTFPARDGTQIPAYLTLPPGSDGKGLPAIVLPHGGPSARDEWGFDWLVQFFVARGYAVLQPNYRGSAGYGQAWFGRNGFKAWETAVGDVNDAGRWLVSEGIASADKLAIAGWSYGGYAALQSQVLDPELYNAVVAIAPVTDLQDLRREAQPYTHSILVDRFVGDGPHIEAGSPARHADRFAAPVMLVHGTLDRNVSHNQSRKMEDRLEDAGKPVTYIEFEGLEHGIRDSQARKKMLLAIDGFLSEALGD